MAEIIVHEDVVEVVVEPRTPAVVEVVSGRGPRGLPGPPGSLDDVDIPDLTLIYENAKV